MMGTIGIGILSLAAYVVVILLANMVFKRKMAEAMLWAFVLLLAIGVLFAGKDLAALAGGGFSYAARQEVVYASMAFVFMAYLMEKTGIIGRLVNILNSLLGRLPGGSGYVSTIGSALFGMVSGSGSGNASAVGAITIPWMERTGWSKERATTIVAGNAGLGMVFPPSSSMLLLLGMESISAEVTDSSLYLSMMGVAVLVLAYRLAVVFIYARKDGMKPVPADDIMPLGMALRENGKSLLIFLGVLIPLLLTMGPLGDIIGNVLDAGADGASKSLSIVLWIPVLMSFFTVLEGWDKLPHTVGGWIDLMRGSVGRYAEVGCLLFFAFAGSRVLIQMGLESEMTALFSVIGAHSPALVIAAVAVLTTIMVGPFTGTATTTAIGPLSYAALRSIGLEPVAACVAFLNLISNEGCVPPNSAPIYIASGISGLQEPARIFKNLLLHYALPVILIAALIMSGILPV